MANPETRSDSQTKDPWLKKNVLTFDGGGVRGFYSLLFIQKLMQYIQQQEQKLGPIGDVKTSQRMTSFCPCQEPPNLSQLHEDEKYTPYLPCHYFDYIAGTSTGGLIAILLGRFRMTVEDCIDEYQRLAGDVFGHPRHIHDIRTLGIVKRCKYDTDNFEHVIKNVIMRRVEGGRDNRQNARFDIEYGLCRVFVIANSIGSAGVTEHHRVFRSYEMKPKPESETDPTEDIKAKQNGRPVDVCVWHVARATTAAPMYFEPLELTIDDSLGRTRINSRHHRRKPARGQISRNHTGLSQTARNSAIPLPIPQVERLQDGGFGPANNPSKEMLDELGLQLPKHMGVGTFVSIGTARPKEEPRGSRFQRIIKDGLARLGDPEPTHRHMENVAHEKFSYYRLNEPDGLHGVKMDDWEPKPRGDATMETMRNAFNNYCGKPEIVRKIQRCAKELVIARRGRVAANMPKWKRFALGRHFYCKLDNCPDDDYRREVDEVKFVAHLKEGHNLNEAQIKEELENCEGQWVYRGR